MYKFGDGGYYEDFFIEHEEEIALLLGRYEREGKIAPGNTEE